MIPYGRHDIEECDIEAVVQALRGARITQGPLVNEFEDALADYLGAAAVTVCANGTAALQLVYAALGIGDGDEIITSPITFAATATAARWLGAEVRFGDVNASTGNIDVECVARLITPRTKAIVAVHLGGLPADLAELRQLADEHGVFLIEDACHALGARYRGAIVGSGIADASVFSFHPVKHITTGEGGAIAVRDVEVKRRMDRLRHHGIERDPNHCERWHGPWYYEIQHIGFNYRLTDIQCALGISQLTRQRRWLEERRRVARSYADALPKYVGDVVEAQTVHCDRESSFHLYPVFIDFDSTPSTRAEVMHELVQCGVTTQVHYIPLTEQPYFRHRYGHVILPGARQYYQRELSLPIYPGLTDEQVDYVARALGAAIYRERNTVEAMR